MASVNSGGTPSGALLIGALVSIGLVLSGTFDTLIAIASFCGCVHLRLVQAPGSAAGARTAVQSLGLSLDNNGSATGVCRVSPCIGGQRHQAHSVYPGIDRHELSHLSLQGKEENSQFP